MRNGIGSLFVVGIFAIGAASPAYATKKGSGKSSMLRNFTSNVKKLGGDLKSDFMKTSQGKALKGGVNYLKKNGKALTHPSADGRRTLVGGTGVGIMTIGAVTLNPVVFGLGVGIAVPPLARNLYTMLHDWNAGRQKSDDTGKQMVRFEG